jgi:hypothetical protein
MERFRLGARLLRRTGVQRVGRDSLVITIEGRSYWVHARVPDHPGGEYVVATSDVRDITNSPTIVAAPPAAAGAIPEVTRRLEQYLAVTKATVRYR